MKIAANVSKMFRDLSEKVIQTQNSKCFVRSSHRLPTKTLKLVNYFPLDSIAEFLVKNDKNNEILQRQTLARGSMSSDNTL